MNSRRNSHAPLQSSLEQRALGSVAPVFALSAIALVLLSAFSPEVMGEEALLQFEQVPASELLAPAEVSVTPSSPVQSSPSQTQVYAAPPPQPIKPQISTAASTVNPIAIPLLPDTKPAPVTTQAAPVNKGPLPGISALSYGVTPVVSGIAGGGFSHTELELRQIFLRASQAAAEYSPSIRSALAQEQASQSDIDEVKGQRLPQVQVGSRSKAMEFGSGNRSDSNAQALTIDVVTPVFDWGRIGKSINSREYLATAAGAAVQAELESSAFDVTSNLLELGKQRIIVDISQKFVVRMTELAQMLGGIVAVDRGRVSELTQAKARLLQAEASRSTAQARVRDIEINLYKLLGERALPPLPRSHSWNIPQADMEALLSAARHHPIIERAKAQAISADLQADAVRSSALPQLNWSVGKTTGEDALGREPAWQTNLSMSWSAFSGGSTRAAERAARQRAEAGREETGQQVLDLDYRIRAANNDARTMLERAEQYRELSVETDSVRQSFYEQWYHLGKRTLLDVLNAETDYYGNQVSEINSRFDGYGAIIRQYASAGTLVQWLSDGK